MNFIQENLLSILSYLFGAGGISAFLFERRKNKAVTKGVEADVDAKEINNGSKVIEVYQNTLDDLTKRYEEKFNDITEMYDRKIKVLEDEIRLHKRAFNLLKKENAELKRKLSGSNSSK